MKNRSKQLIATALTLVLFSTNALFAYSAETNFWKDRKHPVQMAGLPLPLSGFPSALSMKSSITAHEAAAKRGADSALLSLLDALPAQTGAIRKIALPRKSSGRTVIHIQDVHHNPEAQANIERTIDQLMQRNAIGSVALEGAFGPIDLTWYRASGLTSSIRSVADYLLRTNRIAGPVHAALVRADRIPSFVGIDDAAHYNANVEAVRRSAVLKPHVHANVLQRVQALETEKKSILNEPLREFDRQVALYRQGSLPWSDYIALLAHRTDNVPSGVAGYVHALALEREIDFTRMEAERNALIRQLVTKLGAAEQKSLLAETAAYRAGVVGHADFYTFLKEFCERNGVALARFPTLDKYIRYVTLADGLDVDAVVSEALTLEKKIFAAISSNDRERNLIAESRRLYLTEKLLDFALTKSEWQEYAAMGAQPELASFERFYREAEIRDARMADNFLKSAEHANVLVTGGFHSAGIDQKLIDAGYSVITFSPKVTKLSDASGSAYLSVFTQEKTPLDRLFAGEKLFLSTLAVPNRTIVEPMLRLDAELSDGHHAAGSTPLSSKLTLGETRNPETGKIDDFTVNSTLASEFLGEMATFTEEALQTPLEAFGLPRRTRVALADLGIEFVEELVGATYGHPLSTRHMGGVLLTEVRDKVERDFRMRATMISVRVLENLERVVGAHYQEYALGADPDASSPTPATEKTIRFDRHFVLPNALPGGDPIELVNFESNHEERKFYFSIVDVQRSFPTEFAVTFYRHFVAINNPHFSSGRFADRGVAVTIMRWLAELANVYIEEGMRSAYPFEIHQVRSARAIEVAKQLFEDGTLQIYDWINDLWLDVSDPANSEFVNRTEARRVGDFSLRGNVRATALQDIGVLLADKPASDQTVSEVADILSEFGDGARLVNATGVGKDKQKLLNVIATQRPAVIVIRSATKAFGGEGSEELMESAKILGLKAIIRAGAGVDNINVAAAERNGIQVMRTHGNANSIANLTLRFLLAGLEHVVAIRATDKSSDDVARAWPAFDMGLDEFQTGLAKTEKGKLTPEQFAAIFHPISPQSATVFLKRLEGKTIGLVGFGPIAQGVARKLQAIKAITGINFTVAATSRSLDRHDPEALKLAEELGVVAPGRDAVIRDSFVLSLHLPSGAETKNFLTAELLENSTAKVLINTSRQDLIAADVWTMSSKKLPFHYFADVDFNDATAALSASHPDRVHLTPHLGASTPNAAAGVELNTKSMLRDVVASLKARSGKTNIALLVTVAASSLAIILKVTIIGALVIAVLVVLVALLTMRAPMERYEASLFRLSRFRHVRDQFSKQFRAALRGKRASVRALRTFGRQPTGQETGRFVSINWGGTNASLMVVDLQGGGHFEKGAEIRFPFSEEQIKNPALAFDAIADSVIKLIGEDRTTPIGIGFIFSFALDQQSLRSGTLLHWSKGWQDPEHGEKFVGRDVGQVLTERLHRRGFTNMTVTALANDTLNPMTVYSYQARGRNPSATAADLGTILGTGHNTAVEVNGEIINLESGNFNGVWAAQTPEDRFLDRSLSEPKPGAQLLEKMTAGKYLPEVLRMVLRNMSREFPGTFEGIQEDVLWKPFSLDGANLSVFANDRSDGLKESMAVFADRGLKISLSELKLVQRMAQAVLRRSAYLVAAEYAGIIQIIDPRLERDHVIAVEGSVFTKNLDYHGQVDRALFDLLGKNAKKIKLVAVEGAEGVGVAILAAALASENGKAAVSSKTTPDMHWGRMHIGMILGMAAGFAGMFAIVTYVGKNFYQDVLGATSPAFIARTVLRIVAMGIVGGVIGVLLLPRVKNRIRAIFLAPVRWIARMVTAPFTAASTFFFIRATARRLHAVENRFHTFDSGVTPAVASQIISDMRGREKGGIRVSGLMAQEVPASFSASRSKARYGFLVTLSILLSASVGLAARTGFLAKKQLISIDTVRNAQDVDRLQTMLRMQMQAHEKGAAVSPSVAALASNLAPEIRDAALLIIKSYQHVLPITYVIEDEDGFVRQDDGTYDLGDLFKLAGRRSGYPELNRLADPSWPVPPDMGIAIASSQAVPYTADERLAQSVWFVLMDSTYWIVPMITVIAAARLALKMA